jgi:hypothetical protein
MSTADDHATAELRQARRRKVESYLDHAASEAGVPRQDRERLLATIDPLTIPGDGDALDAACRSAVASALAANPFISRRGYTAPYGDVKPYGRNATPYGGRMADQTPEEQRATEADLHRIMAKRGRPTY